MRRSAIVPRNVFAGARSPAPRIKRVLIVFLQPFEMELQFTVSLSTRRVCLLPYSHVHTTTCGLPSLMGMVLQSVSLVVTVAPSTCQVLSMPQPMQPDGLSARP